MSGRTVFLYVNDSHKPEDNPVAPGSVEMRKRPCDRDIFEVLVLQQLRNSSAELHQISEFDDEEFQITPNCPQQGDRSPEIVRSKLPGAKRGSSKNESSWC